MINHSYVKNINEEVKDVYINCAQSDIEVDDGGEPTGEFLAKLEMELQVERPVLLVTKVGWGGYDSEGNETCSVILRWWYNSSDSPLNVASSLSFREEHRARRDYWEKLLNGESETSSPSE